MLTLVFVILSQIDDSEKGQSAGSIVSDRYGGKTVAMISWVLIDERPALFIIIGGAIILSVALYESLMNRRP